MKDGPSKEHSMEIQVIIAIYLKKIAKDYPTLSSVAVADF